MKLKVLKTAEINKWNIPITATVIAHDNLQLPVWIDDKNGGWDVETFFFFKVE